MKITVQNAETPASIAQKFGCSEKTILKMNKSYVDGLGNRYFEVGDKIRIPGEFNADDTRIAQRKNVQEAKNDYVTSGGAAREAEVNSEVESRKNITWVERKNNTFEAIARDLFRQENIENPTNLQLSARIKDMKKDNPGLKDGQLIGKKIVAGVNQGKYNALSLAQQQREAKQMLDTQNKIRQQNFEIGKDLYDYCDKHTYACDDKEFKALLHKITPDNVVNVLEQYEAYMKKYNKNDTSLIDTIRSEYGADNNKEALNYIMTQLEKAAEKAGVNKYDVRPSISAYKSLVSSYHSGSQTTRSMEQYVREVMNQITSAQNKDGSISEADAVRGFAGQAAELNSAVQSEYANARKQDNWAAKTGDVVCGWFGCKTVDEMNAKLSSYDKNVQDLVKTAQSGDMKAFKDKYFKLFGKEFDPAKVQARENAISKYSTAKIYESTRNFYNDLNKSLKNERSLYRNKNSKECWNRVCAELAGKYKNSEMTAKKFEQTIEAYAAGNNLKYGTEEEKFAALNHFIKTSFDTAEVNRIKTMDGKSYAELEREINNCNNAMFGAKGNLLPEVREFNQNMQKTQAYTEMVAEIGVTIATMAVPGLGAAAAAKLATSAVRLGATGARLARGLNVASKGFSAISKSMASDSLAVRMATNGAMTTVGSSAGQYVAKGEVDVKQSLKSGLYGSLGALSSKVSEQFVEKISTRLTSNLGQKVVQESTEDIIDAIASFVLEAGNYGSVDAYTDAAMNFVMSRLGSSKGKAKGADVETPSVRSAAPQAEVTLKPETNTVPKAAVKAEPEMKPQAEVKPDTEVKTETEAPTVKPDENVSTTPLMDKYLNSDIDVSKLTPEDLDALDIEINEIMNDLLDNKYDNPQAVIEKVETVLEKVTFDVDTQKNNNIGLNIIRKKNGLPKKTYEIKTPAGEEPKVENFDINETFNSRDSEQIRKAKIELYDVIKDKGISDEEMASLLKKINDENIDFARKILNDPNFTADKADRAKEMIWNCIPGTESLCEKIYLDKSISSEAAERILMYANKENAPFAEYLLSAPEFDRDKIGSALAYVKGKESVANILIKDKEISSQNTIDILAVTDNNNIKVIEDCCKNYKDLGIHTQQIVRVGKGQCSVQDLQLLNKTFGMEVTAKFENVDYDLAVDFMPYITKENISELSKTEKKDLLMKVLMNKSKVENNHLSDVCPLIPVDSVGYENIIRKLTQSLNLDSKTLSDARVAAFDANLNELSTSLRDMDLSGLREINLSVPHSEFISNINNLMKDLSPAEQAKIQDYFGFRVENGKLTGYPNVSAKDLADFEITDKASVEVLNKMKPEIERYTSSNFVTTNDIPELNRMLKNISQDMPELFNQIDGSVNSVNMIKSMQQVVQNPKFETLSDSDKKVLMLSALLHNTDKASGSAVESAFDAYFIGKKFGISDVEAQKLYRIVQTSDSVEQFMASTKDKATAFHYSRTQREELFDTLAFNLREGNDFELAQMLYSTKEKPGLTRNLDKALQSRISQMKSNDFMLPQTSQATYRQHAKRESITRDGETFDVNVVNAADIDNFYAFIHTPEAGYVTGGSRSANFANFEIFKDFADDKVICTSYVGNGRASLVEEYHHGFIFDVANDHQYVGYGRDIWSDSKNLSDMRSEYYTPNGIKNGNVLKYDQRTMISDALKTNLMGEDYKAMVNSFDTKKQEIVGRYQSSITALESKRRLMMQEKTQGGMTQTQYNALRELPEIKEIEAQIIQLKRTQNTEIQALPEFAKIKEADANYVARMDKIKQELGTETMTIEKLEQIDPEFAKAYKQLLDAQKDDGGAFLLNQYHHNEVLVSNPKITALYTDDINNIPVEYLKKAQEENLPIVIIKNDRGQN